MYRPSIKNGILQLGGKRKRKRKNQKSGFLRQLALAAISPLICGIFDKALRRKKGQKKD